MNHTKNKRRTGDAASGRRGTAASVKRIENKLEHVVTRDDLKAFATRDDWKVFATREDLANMKISMIRWTIGSMLALAGITVTAFKWFLP